MSDAKIHAIFFKIFVSPSLYALIDSKDFLKITSLYEIADLKMSFFVSRP